MGKVKQKQKNRNHHDSPNGIGKNIGRRQYSQKVPQHVKEKFSATSKAKFTGKQQPQARERVPFSKWDSVLLVGEGDFSFALSLAQNYEVGAITATSFDTHEALEQKYTGIRQTLSKLRRCLTHKHPQSSKDDYIEETSSTSDWDGFSPSPEIVAISSAESDSATQAKVGNITVLHGIDATKLSTTHKKVLRRHSPFTKILFNFPHVGGLSTDVNRQVRANQELLVGFFNAAKPLLATSSHPARLLTDKLDADYDVEMHDDDLSNRSANLAQGQLVVTIFDGEPYTLWNIRDLARHCGFQVVESFKFPWAAYPGYQHARTIGDITSGKDRSKESKRKGAWRGEERVARSYVLGLKSSEDDDQQFSKKRSKGDEDSDSD